MSNDEGKVGMFRRGDGNMLVSGPHVTERHLGRLMRAMYDALPVEPPSERLNDLLRQLDGTTVAAAETGAKA